MDKEEVVKMIREGSEHLGKISGIMISVDWLYNNGYRIISKEEWLKYDQHIKRAC